MRSPRLAALELKRFGRGKLPRAALVALLLLPLLYGALYLWSFWDPYGRLDKIPVALVNEDKGATVGGEKLQAGDNIVSGLRESKTFDWREVSPEEARDGVAKGRYYLSLTVPSDFSERVGSSSGENPETGALQVSTNDSNNYIVGQISRSVFSEVRRSASKKTSRTFLDKIFVSFSDIHQKTEKAAEGADQLEDGIGKAKKGAGELATGLGDAKNGSKSLKTGVDKLTTGANDLKSGSKQVADGTQQLADKVNLAAGKVRPFFNEHGKQIGDLSRDIVTASNTMTTDLNKLPERAQKAEDDLRAAAAFASGLYASFCEGGPKADAVKIDCETAKKHVTNMNNAATTAKDFNALVKDHKNVDQLKTHVAALKKMAEDLGEKAPTLGQDLDASVKKINELNKGAKAVAKGASDLHAGLTTAKTGVSSLDTGIGKLSNGANTLSGGMYKLVDGSGELATGLHDGAKKIPDYDKDQRDLRTDVMADPVQLANQAMHKADTYGTGFAPYFIPLSLWVGAMVSYMLIQPLNRRAMAAGASAWRIALAGWLPVAALGVLQTAALMSVLHWGLGLKMERAAGTIGFLLLVTACFTALIQLLNARFGPAGRILVLALLMLQLTSAGGTYPVETSPGFFNAIHPYLPMTHVVEGLRRLITGGDLGVVWTGCAVLAAYTVGSLALTALSARQKQVWKLDKLHPELSL
ncbi:YhgE/Pip family protein [Streptomyces sp. URMC 123]|uniref:YhgE/Pip family protein n=1 Tax=Streptomyces sp. URMC 123 TaxID=3423403 RepID=UPI003F1C0C91